MFTPPRCPNEGCSQHANPQGTFFRRTGFYVAKCRSHRVPRFRCHSCGRSFSRQTFRADYRDKKPHLNQEVVKLLCSGLGLRESAYRLGLTRRNLILKARKLSRQSRWLDRNLKVRAADQDVAAPSDAPLELQFDEFETYETKRITRPLTLATVIEKETRLIIGMVAAPIRPHGRMSKARLASISKEEAQWGPRAHRSLLACRAALRSAAQLRPAAPLVILESDQKSTYPGLFAKAFKHTQRRHSTTPGSAPRGFGTPLCPINLTEAILRDHAGRMRRQSWLVSKKRTYLNLYLNLYMAARNWARRRFNQDEHSAGVLGGLTPRNLKLGELCGWRQDWGRLSPCPFGRGGRSVGMAWPKRWRSSAGTMASLP